MAEKTKFTLRIEPELLGKITYMADFNSRSTNREIETAIKRYVRDFERLNGTISVENRLEK